MPAGGGTSQTAVNRQAGRAHASWPSWSPRRRALATLLLLAPVIALDAAGRARRGRDRLFGRADQAGRVRRDPPRAPRPSSSGPLVAFAGVVLLGTLKGILVAVIVSLLALAQQAYNPPVYVLGRKRGTNVFRPLRDEHPDDETWPGPADPAHRGPAVLRQRRSASATDRGAGRRSASLASCVLDCSAVFDIEYTALKMLTEAEEKLAARRHRALAGGAQPRGAGEWCGAHRSANARRGACSPTSRRRSGIRSEFRTILKSTINLRRQREQRTEEQGRSGDGQEAEAEAEARRRTRRRAERCRRDSVPKREAQGQGLRKGAGQAARRAGQAAGVGRSTRASRSASSSRAATAPARAAPSRRSPSASARACSASSRCPRRPSARRARCTSSATCRTCRPPARS